MPYGVIKSKDELEAVIDAIDAADPNEEDDHLQAQRNALRFACGWDSETPQEYIDTYVGDAAGDD
jgi:hypothetical protein